MNDFICGSINLRGGLQDIGRWRIANVHPIEQGGKRAVVIYFDDASSHVLTKEKSTHTKHGMLYSFDSSHKTWCRHGEIKITPLGSQNG